MKKLLIALSLLSLPAMAQMQFDSAAPKTSPLPSGLAWLNRQPVTLFDLGLMELTRQANDEMKLLTGLGGAVAEYREDLGLILISFYPASPYRSETCTNLIMQIRQMLFPTFKDKSQLAGQLASVFSNYGPQAAGRPESIGAELVAMTHLVVRMQGGGCQLKVGGAAPEHVTEPGYKESEAPKEEKKKE